MNESQYEKLINRFLAGEASEAESRELEVWVNASKGNRQIFTEVEKLWLKINVPAPSKTPPFEEFWRGLENKRKLVSAEPSARVVSIETARQKRETRFWASTVQPRWLAAAAILLMAIGASVIYQFVLKRDGGQIYATQNAERLSVDLPDGSQVELHAASELRFKDSDTLRVAVLAGQAFFRVKADSRPFVVYSENAEVSVLGTSFDVYARKRNTRVAVEEGKVSLNTLDAVTATKVFLTAGQMSMVREKLSPSAPIMVERIASWREQKFVFEDTPLLEITEELQRVYDLKIEVVDSSLYKLAVTGIFEQEPVEDILAAICLTLHLKYKATDEGYRISK